MAEEKVVENSRMKEAMAELMKTEAGRELAEQLRSKLKAMNDQFKGLSDEDKKNFAGEFREKFADSFNDLKDSFKEKLGDGFNGADQSAPPPSRYTPEPNYYLFLIAIAVILIVFG